MQLELELRFKVEAEAAAKLKQQEQQTTQQQATQQQATQQQATQQSSPALPPASPAASQLEPPPQGEPRPAAHASVSADTLAGDKADPPAS